MKRSRLNCKKHGQITECSECGNCEDCCFEKRDPDNTITTKQLSGVIISLPTDYSPWGNVQFGENDYTLNDCSCGCKWFLGLAGQDKRGGDYGVCCNPKSPRKGMLTFEHQGGFGCFEYFDCTEDLRNEQKD